MWSLYDENNKFLEPIKYTTGKTQEDITKEIIEAIKSGEKIIFLKGSPGTGKSAIALNIAKHFGKTSIVVPVKYLQKQYEEDYTNKLSLKKENGEKLNIKVITGRNNHACKYIEGKTADYDILPCKIEIKKENIDWLKQYVKENPDVHEDDFEEIKDYTRASVGCACPFCVKVAGLSALCIPDTSFVISPSKTSFSVMGPLGLMSNILVLVPIFFLFLVRFLKLMNLTSYYYVSRYE